MIETERFGKVETPLEQVYTFPEGLPGFPTCKRFALMRRGNGPMWWLQSCDNPRLAFVVADPRRFLPGYRVMATREDVSPIGLESPDDSMVLVILNVPADPSRTTANLRGPLVLNTERRLARQLVLQDDFWPLRYSVFGD